jgi:ATP-dependent helicase HrpA
MILAAAQQRCLSEVLIIAAVLEVQDPEAQLPTRRSVTDERSDEQRHAAIHQSLLAGLLSNVAQRGDGYEYTGAGGMTFHPWPGSGVFAGKPKWIMAAELVC